MHIIVGGCGRVGAELAEQLSTDPEVDVVAVDVDPTAFERLGSAFNGETLIGDITDRDVLEQAGAARGDVLMAATRSDNANLMAVEIGTVLYGIPTAIARLFDPDREDVYRRLGVSYVSGTGILVELFLNQIRSDGLPRHVHFRHGNVAIVDLTIGPEGAGCRVSELEREGRLRVAAVQRGTDVWVPDGDDRLEPGDVVTAAVRRGIADSIRNLLQPLAGPGTRGGWTRTRTTRRSQAPPDDPRGR